MLLFVKFCKAKWKKFLQLCSREKILRLRYVMRWYYWIYSEQIGHSLTQRWSYNLIRTLGGCRRRSWGLLGQWCRPWRPGRSTGMCSRSRCWETWGPSVSGGASPEWHSESEESCSCCTLLRSGCRCRLWRGWGRSWRIGATSNCWRSASCCKTVRWNERCPCTTKVQLIQIEYTIYVRVMNNTNTYM